MRQLYNKFCIQPYNNSINGISKPDNNIVHVIRPDLLNLEIMLYGFTHDEEKKVLNDINETIIRFNKLVGIIPLSDAIRAIGTIKKMPGEEGGNYYSLKSNDKHKYYFTIESTFGSIYHELAHALTYYNTADKELYNADSYNYLLVEELATFIDASRDNQDLKIELASASYDLLNNGEFSQYTLHQLYNDLKYKTVQPYTIGAAIMTYANIYHPGAIYNMLLCIKNTEENYQAQVSNCYDPYFNIDISKFKLWLEGNLKYTPHSIPNMTIALYDWMGVDWTRDDINNINIAIEKFNSTIGILPSKLKYHGTFYNLNAETSNADVEYIIQGKYPNKIIFDIKSIISDKNIQDVMTRAIIYYNTAGNVLLNAKCNHNDLFIEGIANFIKAEGDNNLIQEYSQCAAKTILNKSIKTL